MSGSKGANLEIGGPGKGKSVKGPTLSQIERMGHPLRKQIPESMSRRQDRSA